jgi:hypothetical protein
MKGKPDQSSFDDHEDDNNQVEEEVYEDAPPTSPAQHTRSRDLGTKKTDDKEKVTNHMVYNYYFLHI